MAGTIMHGTTMTARTTVLAIVVALVVAIFIQAVAGFHQRHNLMTTTTTTTTTTSRWPKTTAATTGTTSTIRWRILSSQTTTARSTVSTTAATATTTTATISSSSLAVARRDVPYTSTDTVICGAGPAGLLTAIMLARKFPDQKIKVYDRLSRPPASPTDETVWWGTDNVAKFYLVGLGGRAQVSLRKLGVWDDVQAVCSVVVGRKDWAPGSTSEDDGVERIFEGRKYQTQCLPRDKLVAVLYQYITTNFPMEQIELRHGFEVKPVAFGGRGNDSGNEDEDDDFATLEIFHCNGQSERDLECNVDPVERVTTKLLIAADGTARTVANAMEEEDRKALRNKNPLQRLFLLGKHKKAFKVTRYQDDNQRVYKTIPMKLPPGWRPDLNYSARSKGGGMNIDALPATRTGDYCGVLLLRKDDPLAQPNVDPTDLRAFMDEYLPQFSAILDDEVVAQVAKNPPSFLPAFRFAGPRLNQGDHTLVLGDAAHTVKPYFGLGAATAMEDVAILSDCINETSNMKEAVHEFSRRRAKDAETLVKISRDLDRPGLLGTVTFIVPIILDSIFHKINPKWFAPNVISMLQREDLTFTQVANRKRQDRAVQVAVLGSAVTLLTLAARLFITILAKALGQKPFTITAALATFFVVFNLWKNLLAKKAMQLFNPNMAPADVLAKLKSKITNQKEAVS